MRVLRSGDLRLAVPKRAAVRDLTPETLSNHDLLSSPITNLVIKILIRSSGIPKTSAIAPCRSALASLNGGGKMLVSRVK